MIRKSLIIFLAIFALAHTPACTSHSSDSAEASDDPDAKLDVDSAAGDSASGGASDEAIADLGDDTTKADSGAAANADGLAADEKLPDDTALDSAAPPAADAGKDAVAGDTPPPADAAAAPTEPTPEPVAKNDEQPAPPADTPPPAEAAAAPTPEPAVPAAAPVASGSLKKIPTAPYKQGKTLVNAVYMARNGDTVKAISQKIYGSEDHVKDICKVNSYNCSRTVKVGDKFYYNSPKRPTDDQAFKTFYEDAGVPAETYTAKDGDNIREVGKQLFGNQRGWMELWATNQDVESKGALAEGTQLKYWPDVAAPAATLADKGDKKADGADAVADAPPPPAPPDAQANTPPPPPPPDLPPPPPEQQAKNDQPAAGAATGTVQPSVPPPPPPPSAAPPPPPPPIAMDKKNPAPAAADASPLDDPNQTMAMGVGAILLLAAVFLVISIRKKRRSKIDYNTATQTQIDS